MNKKSTGIKNTLIFIIIMVTLCNIQAINITVANNSNEMGFDNSSCLLGKIRCFSLDFVFTNLSDCNHNPISVSVLDGNYSFTLNSTVTDELFKNCTAISITGISADNTSIVCGMDAGLAFQNVLQVEIANITFTNCGSMRNSTSVNLTLKSPNATLLLSTALYFLYCKDVQIVNVTVQNSNSTGVVMYNTYEKLLVEGSSFIGNGNQNSSLSSNGGFYAEFVYCDPGKVNESCVQQNNSDATHNFRSSNFINNHASNEDASTLFYLPRKTNYYSFGRGGGLSIIFKGDAFNNTVFIDNCKFDKNNASWGGGLLVEFEDFSKNNTIIINNTCFSKNKVIADTDNGYGTSGGGVRVGFVIFYPNSVEYNSMLFENCKFTRNQALWGGGYGMYMPSEPNVINATNSLIFKGCSWIKNKGLLGSAVDLDFWHIYTAGAKMQVIFSSCTFHGNYHIKKSKQTNSTWREFNTFGTGALYANGMPIVFEEFVKFTNNSGSALAIYDTIARFSDNCNASFINNSAWTGGAIALLGASQIWIYPHTTIMFKNNTAKLKGGAIYALQTSRHDLLSGGNCFLHYSDSQVPSPEDWKTNFTFDGNTAPTGTSIFATTLLSCAWGASFGNLNFNLRTVFTWSNFHYCHFNNNTIATEISKIKTKTNVSMITPAEIIPGKSSKLPITTVDDKGNDITRSLWVISLNETIQVSQNLTDDLFITLQGAPNEVIEYIEIVTDNSRIISAKLPVKLLECPPGYYLNNKTCQCSYLNNAERLDGILPCNSTTFTAKIKRGYWAGYYLSPDYPNCTYNNLVTGQCSKHYCNAQEQEISLPNVCDSILLNELFCSPVNRNGTLCGRCSDGYSVAINSIFFDCVNCSDWLSQHGWLIYALTEYVPSTLLFFTILFFDINLHSGTISSIVLYFQIFTLLNLYSDGDVDPPLHSDGVLKAINFIYNIWNLEFFGNLLSPYCLSKSFNTMDILLIKYISGFYLFILFIIFLILINLVYVNLCGLETMALCLRYIRNCCTRIKFKIVRKGSTVNGLATLWTLVFTKFALISSLILSRENLTGSENSRLIIPVAWLQGNFRLYSHEHLPYVIPAVIVLGFLVILPALGLLCHPLVPQIMGRAQEIFKINFNQYKPYKLISSTLEKPFIRLKPLIDCFQGSCKPRCEFYAGLLMCYRLSVIFLFSFTIRAEVYFYNTALSVIFVIITAVFQPYKKHQDNIITILCISNIILINLISICHLFYNETQVDKNLQPLLWLQLALALLPFAFFVVFMGWRFWRKLKAFWKQEPLYTPVNTDERDELDDFPRRVLEDSDDENTSNVGSASPRLESAYGSASPKGSSQTDSKEGHTAAGSSSGSCLLTGKTTANQ